MIATTTNCQLAPPSPLPISAPRRPAAPAPRLLTGNLQSDILAYVLLNYFSLGEREAKAVESEYGLPRERAEHFIGVRTAPSTVHRLFALYGAAERFGHVKPRDWPSPFYHDGENLGLRAPSAGLLVPVWRGHFRAWLHYQSAKDAAPRWVSSRHLGGPKAEASIHVVGPKPARSNRTALLVSHALEAEAIGYGDDISVAAANGLSPQAVARQLREMWPELRAISVDTPDAGSYARVLELSGLKAEVAI